MQNLVEAADERLPKLYIVAEDFPPFEMANPDNGRHGRDYDLVKRIFAELGFEAEIEFMPWKRAFREATEGDALGVLSCAYSEKRSQLLHYSQPISDTVTGFYTKTDKNLPDVNSLQEAVAFDVGSVYGYTTMDELRKAGVTPLGAEDAKSAILMLEAGRFDYLYLHRESTDFLLHKKGVSQQFKFTPVNEQQFHFCFNKKHPQTDVLVKRFDEKLSELRSNGAYQAIIAPYQYSAKN